LRCPRISDAIQSREYLVSMLSKCESQIVEVFY
jgi:hypothetical protein